MFGFRTNRLLKEFSLAAEADFFYASIWECVVTSAPVRQAALDFVLRHFNKRLSMEDQLHFMGTNIEMLVRTLLFYYLNFKGHSLKRSSFLMFVFMTCFGLTFAL